MSRGWILYGSVLSPFSLKTRFVCERAGLTFRTLPDEGRRAENLAIQARRYALVHGWTKLTHPQLTELDELPLVPFLFGPDGERLYDSTAIAQWLDRHGDDHALYPTDPAVRTLCLVLEEMFDELGLYALHHQRWVTSATDNRATQIAASEFRSLVPSVLRARVGERFAARQVRRLPYLFSVAPAGLHIDRIATHRQPPALRGFPPTHALLENLFDRLLAGLERALVARPFLFGDAPCVADFAAGGVIASHLLVDGTTTRAISARAPHAERWARALLDGPSPRSGDHSLDPALAGLFELASSALVPLLAQNERAWRRAGGGTARAHNERAFDAGRSLYDGDLLGHPFRSVIKTFQVRVLRDLRRELQVLGSSDLERVLNVVPALEEPRLTSGAA